MKVVSIVGARPNFIKLGPLSKELSNRKIDHVIIHTGQHYDYEMSKIFFEGLKIPKPNYNLGVGSDTQARQLSKIIEKCEVLIKEKPDIVIVYGDTNSTLGGALASVKSSIPVAHVEAGIRSHNRKMQEEINRVLTDHLSELLFCPTKNALKNLKKEGLYERAYLAGDIMVDALNMYLSKLDGKILDKIGVDVKDYILLTLHRAENVDDKYTLLTIISAIEELSKEEVVVFPIHPRTSKNLSFFGISLCENKNIKIIKPLGYKDFLTLEKNAKAILTDSGGVQKEAYLLGIPCITLRNETEWMETVTAGWNVLVGVDKEAIISAVKMFRPHSPRPNLFGKGTTAKEIVKILRGVFEH